MSASRDARDKKAVAAAAALKKTQDAVILAAAEAKSTANTLKTTQILLAAAEAKAADLMKQIADQTSSSTKGSGHSAGSEIAVVSGSSGAGGKRPMSSSSEGGGKAKEGDGKAEAKASKNDPNLVLFVIRNVCRINDFITVDPLKRSANICRGFTNISNTFP